MCVGDDVPDDGEDKPRHHEGHCEHQQGPPPLLVRERECGDCGVIVGCAGSVVIVGCAGSMVIVG